MQTSTRRYHIKGNSNRCLTSVRWLQHRPICHHNLQVRQKLDHQDEPATQDLINLLRGCMPGRLVNNTGTFLPSSVLAESTPPTSNTWGIKKLNTASPNLFTPHQDPDSTSATASPDININLFQNFLSDLKLPGTLPAPTIATRPTEPIMEKVYEM